MVRREDEEEEEGKLLGRKRRKRPIGGIFQIYHLLFCLIGWRAPSFGYRYTQSVRSFPWQGPPRLSPIDSYILPI